MRQLKEATISSLYYSDFMALAIATGSVPGFLKCQRLSFCCHLFFFFYVVYGHLGQLFSTLLSEDDVLF